MRLLGDRLAGDDIGHVAAAGRHVDERHRPAAVGVLDDIGDRPRIVGEAHPHPVGLDGGALADLDDLEGIAVAVDIAVVIEHVDELAALSRVLGR